jgi:fructuronate reductase
MIEFAGLRRLTDDSLCSLPAGIRRPSYDRRTLTPRVAHIGAGAFHRCHQAEYAEDLLEAGATDCSIYALNLRAPDLGTLIGEQGGLYSRELRKGDCVERRVIGSILGGMTVLDANYDPYRLSLQKALARASDPVVEVISCTVTEKGYCHIPATGELDLTHPDIAHDIAYPDLPDSLPGFILAVLRRRIARGATLPVIMSCDNVPGNSSTLRRVVLSLAQKVAPHVVDTLAREAVFPDTMVDRIVPATREEDIAGLAAATGFLDAGLVVGEPFRMWAIDDRARDRLPAWDRAGAIFTDKVRSYEILKMRVVNGIQSNMCQLGFLAGFAFMADVMADRLMSGFARETIEQEVASWLPETPGINIPAYFDEAQRRLTNPALRHSCVQISTDGSRKIRQRLIEPILEAHAAGRATPHLLLGLAGWLQYASGRSLDGSSHSISDPLAGEVATLAKETTGDHAAYVRAVVGLSTVFPARFAENPVLVDGLTEALHTLREKGVKEAVRLTLSK